MVVVRTRELDLEDIVRKSLGKILEVMVGRDRETHMHSSLHSRQRLPFNYSSS